MEFSICIALHCSAAMHPGTPDPVWKNLKIYNNYKVDHLHTHTHIQSFYCSSGICPGLPGWSGTRKVKPGRVKPICWALCKSAPHPRQPRQHTTTQFLPDALPATQPTASKHWRTLAQEIVFCEIQSLEQVSFSALTQNTKQAYLSVHSAPLIDHDSFCNLNEHAVLVLQECYTDSPRKYATVH